MGINVPSIPFITKFSKQHQNAKGWYKNIGTFWTTTEYWALSCPRNLPQLIFRGAPSLRDKIPPNVYNSPTRNLCFFQNLKGNYQCRKCQVCTINRCKNWRTNCFTSTSTSRTYEPFITCFTTGVVYLLQCPCGLQYVGKTKRALQMRLNEHINNIIKSFKNHSVWKHYAAVHNRDPSNTLFWGIDRDLIGGEVVV